MSPPESFNFVAPRLPPLRRLSSVCIFNIGRFIDCFAGIGTVTVNAADLLQIQALRTDVCIQSQAMHKLKALSRLGGGKHRAFTKPIASESIYLGSCLDT